MKSHATNEYLHDDQGVQKWIPLLKLVCINQQAVQCEIIANQCIQKRSLLTSLDDYN